MAILDEREYGALISKIQEYSDKFGQDLQEFIDGRKLGEDKYSVAVIDPDGFRSFADKLLGNTSVSKTEPEPKNEPINPEPYESSSLSDSASPTKRPEVSEDYSGIRDVPARDTTAKKPYEDYSGSTETPVGAKPGLVVDKGEGWGLADEPEPESVPGSNQPSKAQKMVEYRAKKKMEEAAEKKALEDQIMEQAAQRARLEEQLAEASKKGREEASKKGREENSGVRDPEEYFGYTGAPAWPVEAGSPVIKEDATIKQASRIVGAQSSMQDEGESSFNMHGDRNLSPSQQEMLDNLDAQADMLRQEQKNGRVGPQRYDEIERELEILRRKWFNLSIELQPKSWGSYPKYDLNIEKSQYGGWLPR